MRSDRLMWLALVLITLSLYLPAVHNGFVNFDDTIYVTRNPRVQSGLTIDSIAWAFTATQSGNWHPLTWISHMIDCQLYGPNPAGHHLTNVLLHAANALLLFGILNQLTGARWRSAFVAALFAWHPLHVESVAWVSERKDVLSTFFWLLTLAAYARYARACAVNGSKPKVYYVLALCFFLLALLSKPMVVTLPFVLLLLDYWPLGRVSWSRNGVGNPNAAKPQGSGARLRQNYRTPPLQYAKTPLSLVLEKLPFLLLAFGVSLITFRVQDQAGALLPLRNLSLGARLANAAVSYLRYTGKLFWPHPLCVLYPHPGLWPVGLVAAAGLFLLGMTGLGIMTAPRRPYFLAGWLWYLGTLAPVIGVIQVGFQSIADRYTYVPLIGLFILLVWGISEFVEHWPQANHAVAIAGVASLVGCLAMSWVQEGYWSDGGQLFRHAIEVTRNNSVAYAGLGRFLARQGKLDEAIVNYQKSLEINPADPNVQYDMGAALAEQGRYSEAVPFYQNALRLQAQYQKAVSGRTSPDGAPDQTDPVQSKLADAMEHLVEAARREPASAIAQLNLGDALDAQHDLEAAARQYHLALQLEPNNGATHYKLGRVLADLGKLDEAEDQLTAAASLLPQDAETRYALGLALLRQGKHDEALRQFREALRLEPEHAGARRQVTALSAAP